MLFPLGQTFHKWTVLNLVGTRGKDRYFACKCECGTIREIPISALNRGKTKQCKSCSLKKINDFESLIGKSFGKWAVLEKVSPKNKNNIRYLCQCECGRQKEVDAYRLRCNQSKACPNCRIKQHGMTGTGIFNTWKSMMYRCYQPSGNMYKYYGGRGIIVCDRWHSFENFNQDMSPRPDGLQLDRINNDGNYELGNCRWVTSSVNNSNQRRRTIRKVLKNIGDK